MLLLTMTYVSCSALIFIPKLTHYFPRLTSFVLGATSNLIASPLAFLTSRVVLKAYMRSIGSVIAEDRLTRSILPDRDELYPKMENRHSSGQAVITLRSSFTGIFRDDPVMTFSSINKQTILLT